MSDAVSDNKAIRSPFGALARAFCLIASTFALAGFADDPVDLTVEEGESVTISTSGTYRTITVNGTLTVDSGAVVTLDNTQQWHQAYLYVGKGVGKSGRLVVRDGASITVPADTDGPYFYLGKAGGHAEVELDNGSLRCWRLFIADELTTGKPSSANIVLKNNSNVYGQNAIFLSHAQGQSECATDNENAVVNVTLESGSLMRTWWFQKYNGARNDFHFRGGRVQAECVTLYGKGDLVMDGTSAYPISLVFPSASNGQGGFYDDISYFFNLKGWGIAEGRVRLIGDCDFEKRGSGTSDQVLALANGAERLSLEYTGNTHVREGGFGLAANTALPVSGTVTLEANCRIDLRGKELSVGALSGAGEVLDTTAAPGTVRFTVADGTTSSCGFPLAAHVGLAKSGAGILEIAGDSFGDIRVDEGRLRLLNRGDVGYDQYRFKVDSAYGDRFDGMHIAELRLYEGAVDITRPYQSLAHALGNASRLFDGVVGNDNNKWWYQCHYQTQPDFTEAYVDICYGVRKPVTSYTWVSAGDTGPADANCRDPGAWRLYGRDRGGEWQELSVVGHRDYTLSERNMESKMFDLDYATRVGCGAVSVSTNAILELADGVTLACTTYFCQGTLTVGEDARLAVGDDSDATIAYPNFTGSLSFEKTGAGTVRLLGPVAGLGAVTVSGGTLKPMVGCDAPWLSYKFVIEARPGGDAYQFGELALYDTSGRRVNLLANLASGSTTGNDAGNLFDDNLATCNWCDKDPFVSEFTLKAADSVAGYLYAPTSAWNNWHKAPSRWKVYARQSASDEWTLLDERAEACDSAHDKTWYGYNKGQPWMFTVVRDTTKAAFDPSVAVYVRNGAILDLTGTATTLAALRCGTEASGTIRGGALATTGTLDLDAETLPRGTVTLPLVLDGTALPASLAGWTVTLNGEPTKFGLAVENGRLTLVPSGLAVFVK